MNLPAFSWILLIAAAASPAAAQPAAADSGDSAVKLDAFTVTGSNLKRTDWETVQPVTRIAPNIDDGEVGTPLELMERVPELGSLSVYENQDGGRVRGGASSIDLRGLGGQNTLVLLNGRRLPAYAMPFGGLVFTNVDNLPLAAVDRVEILRDGASAVYGADATAGVVNFITKRNVNQRQVGFRYGNTSDGAAGESRGTFTYGSDWIDGKGGFLVVLDTYHRDMLMARDRSYAILGDKTGLVPGPFGTSVVWNTLSNIGPYPSFAVVPLTGAPNTLPGLSSSSAYYNASGQLVAGTRSPATFYNDSLDFSLVPSRTSSDVFLSGDRDLTRQIQLFSELSYNHVVSNVQQGPMTLVSTANVDANGNNLVIPATNYYNPFGTRFYGPGTANPTIAPRDVQFTGMDLGLGDRPATITSSQARAVAGLRGTFLNSWSWETAGVYGYNNARDLTHNMVSLSAFTAALDRSTPDAFNFFAGPTANPGSVLAPLRVDSYTGGRSKLALWDAKVSGSVWTLPAGDIQAAAGLEYREESLASDYSPNYTAGDLVGTAISTGFDASRTVRSVYAELSVPLLNSDQRFVLRRAELQLAGRSEDFSGFGSATKPRLGFSSLLVPGVFLRASLGEGFRAPSITQLYGGISSTTSNRVDPFRPQDGNIRRYIFDPPNPNLKPENTKSYNVGLVWEPAFLPGFSVEGDYWRYDLSNQINVISRVTELALEAANGAYSNPYIVRVAPTPTVPIGPILKIIEPLANYQFAWTDGYDVNLNYKYGQKKQGQLVLSADGTYTKDYEVQLDPTQPYTSFPPDLGRPRFRGTGRIEYNRRALSAEVNYQYTSHYDPPDRVTVNGVDYFIPGYGVWNSSVAYTFDQIRWFKSVTVALGMNNVANTPPPLYPTRQGYDARLFSPQGRFLYVNVTLNF